MEEILKKWLFNPTAGKVLVAVVGLALVYVVGRALQRLANRYFKDADSRYRARKGVSFARFLAAILVLATVFSDRLGGLTVAVGVAGAGIAFALQEVIASIAGWMAISSGGFYSTGDRVQLGGIKGDVIDIGVLRTTLMEVGQWVNGDLYNGRIVRVANSYVFKEPVFNYSADFPFLWDEITLPVRFGSDWKMARAMLAAVAQEVCGEYAKQSKDAWAAAVSKYRLEDAQVDTMVTMAVNDNWIEFTLRYIVDFQKRRSTKDRLFARILEEVGKYGDRVRLASATFEIVGCPKLEFEHQGDRDAVVKG